MERKPSYIQFTPKRSIPSFENLVALANYEERLKDARKIVWRDRGELPVEIHDLWECFKHATRGGLSELNPLMSLRASKPHNNQLRGWLSRVHNPCGGESDLALDEIKTNQEVRHRGIVPRYVDHENPRLNISFREHRFAMIRHALLGQDCFRFAAMLGTWNVTEVLV